MVSVTWRGKPMIKTNLKKESSALKFSLSQIGVWFKALKVEIVGWIPKAAWATCMREAGRVCLQEIFVATPRWGNPKSWRWLGGGEMARSQGKTKQSPEQVDLDKILQSAWDRILQDYLEFFC